MSYYYALLLPKKNGLRNGLIGYWKLDESGTPSTFADATGNGWTGANNGSVSTTTSGKINNGINPTTTTQGVSISSSLDTRASSTPFSVSLWFNNATGTGTGAALIGEWGTRNDYIIFNSAGQGATFRANDDSGTPTDVNSPALDVFGWSHLVFGFDGSQIFFYINNGSLVTASKSAVRRGGGSFVIGNYQGATFGWIGILDEVAYYNRALTSTDVAHLYNAGAALPFSSFTT